MGVAVHTAGELRPMPHPRFNEMTSTMMDDSHSLSRSMDTLQTGTVALGNGGNGGNPNYTDC